MHTKTVVERKCLSSNLILFIILIDNVMGVFRGNSFTLLGDTPARFAIRLFIIMGMSDGVVRGKIVRPYGELQQCWHANSANKICTTRIHVTY